MYLYPYIIHKRWAGQDYLTCSITHPISATIFSSYIELQTHQPSITATQHHCRRIVVSMHAPRCWSLAPTASSGRGASSPHGHVLSHCTGKPWSQTIAHTKMTKYFYFYMYKKPHSNKHHNHYTYIKTSITSITTLDIYHHNHHNHLPTSSTTSPQVHKFTNAKSTSA